MNLIEANNTFDLYYNNLSSNQAPGLDMYEKSEYMTRALLKVVDALYSSYEKDEMARKALSRLIKTYKATSPSVANINKFCNDSVFFELPDDLLYLVHEKLDVTGVRCLEGYVRVLPVRHDNIDNVIRNPFKYNEDRAIRLDIGNQNKYSEIIYKNKDKIKAYSIRYIKKPMPIIFVDLNTNFGNGVSIDGYSGPIPQNNTDQISELDLNFHRNIVEVAAQLAYADYKNIK